MIKSAWNIKLFKQFVSILNADFSTSKFVLNLRQKPRMKHRKLRKFPKKVTYRGFKILK